MSPTLSLTITANSIENKIYIVRGHKVMLSRDLAMLYGVEPKVLIQAVKRNMERFPIDFMFKLSRSEFGNLKSQIVTSSWGGIRRAMPYAFTEQGVAMLSSVLNSKRAVCVNIQIMRTFTRLREFLSTHKELALKLQTLERKFTDHDNKFTAVFDAIRNLIETRITDKGKKRIIGFKA